MKKIYFYNFSICNIGIAEKDGALCRIFFCKEKIIEGYERKETPFIKNASKQLGEYFNGKRKSFDLPLFIEGTDFQKTVWEALQKIPYGETRSYKDLAVMAGNPKASRAVGMANNRNPLAIIIPCHRVIGSDGSLTGYAGGLELKRELLLLESNYK